ncbi:MAG: hypothetical protein CMJ59_06990 [Planctomycetaceae bacterium]|nr:hypothetical protein [Planctomycetaceae bacterium]
MLDRASTFSDPEVVKLLKTRFIPVAIDQAYQRRQQDAEGRFYQKIANQGPRKVGRGTTQGLYVATADGRFLGFNNNRGPARVKRMLNQALIDFRPVDVRPITRGKPDTKYVRIPPRGGLVIRVTSKVLGGYAETNDRWRQMFQQSLGRDNLWVRRDEHQALVGGRLQESLTQRLARFHLVDNTRGEPPMWKANEIRKFDVSLKEGQLRGKIHLQTASGDRGYEADLVGFVASQDGLVTRFDAVVKGEFWGEGRYTRGAPKGRFPFAVAFTLATGADVANKVPPQGSRGWLDGYIR